MQWLSIGLLVKQTWWDQFTHITELITFIDAFGETAQFFPLIADGIIRHLNNWNGRALPENVAVGDSFSTLGPTRAAAMTYFHCQFCTFVGLYPALRDPCPKYPKNKKSKCWSINISITPEDRINRIMIRYCDCVFICKGTTPIRP